MIPKRLENLLNEKHVWFKSLVHPEAYTAQEIAATLHVKGKELAKSVIVRANGDLVMAVLPAHCKVDFKKLREALGEKAVKLASEDEFRGVFSDCETGAEPPFGNLYNIETVVDRSLTEDENIYFNAGTHYEAVEMRYKDFEEIVKPRVAEFGEEP
ncbi:MAG TPA: deacylase [Deltaproteobacteria bacterium]|nr:MAG: deacylase [Deltaproteobacteria bacterium GWA2_55_82]OGQ65251.1 MAG: deacylase [Deltaproteobacteria bacterium RIFCSPLOWO2_02_FULL_55_12]OIJ74811.1 MAG: deacylase [Deltaproteobacteria bacterium GWC2_55_46]HBG45743.1 deacylase [Deltaproteobacteria bacterium]HCY11152.1 deacylase [Deltaproteobacteria bacterium]